MVVPFVNKEMMKTHLLQISKATVSNRHAVVIMDGAGWHTDNIDTGLDNVSIIKLPPYSPELNPIEQVWSWLRQHHLANRSFKGYDNIVDEVCKAWNDFVSIPLRIKSMCFRDWMKLTS